jgi:hypothetical protein
MDTPEPEKRKPEDDPANADDGVDGRIRRRDHDDHDGHHVDDANDDE